MSETFYLYDMGTPGQNAAIDSKTFLDKTSTTVIRAAICVGQDLRLPAEMCITPWQELDHSPGHTFYRFSLSGDFAACKLDQSQKRAQIRHWAGNVADRLWQVSDCDFNCVAVASTREYEGYVSSPDIAHECNPSSTGGTQDASSCAVASTSEGFSQQLREREKAGRTGHGGPAADIDRRPSSTSRRTTPLPQRGYEQHQREYRQHEVGTHNDSASLDCAASIAHDIVLGATHDITWIHSAMDLLGSNEHTAMTLDELEECFWKKGNEGTVATFTFNLLAGFVASLLPYKRSGNATQKSKKSRCKKLAKLLALVIHNVAEQRNTLTFSLLTCLAVAAARGKDCKLKFKTLDLLPFEELGHTAAKVTSLLLALDDITWATISDQVCVNPALLIHKRTKLDIHGIMRRLGWMPLAALGSFVKCDADLLVWTLWSLSGFDVPVRIFQWLRDTQARWNDSGEHTDITLRATGIPTHLADFLMDEERVEQAMHDLSTSRVVAHGSWEVSLSRSKVMEIERLPDNILQKWRAYGLLLVAFIFPRDQLIQAEFHYRGRALAPLVRRMPNFFTTRDHPICCISDIVAMLIAFSKFGPLPDRCRAIEMASDVIANSSQIPFEMSVALAHRRSVLLRLNGEIEESLQLIAQVMTQRCFPYLDSSTGQLDSSLDRTKCVSYRHYAECGRLLLSLIEGKMQLGLLREASEEIFRWDPGQPCSTYEFFVTRAKNLLISKLYYWRGNFDMAMSQIEACEQMIRVEDTNKLQVVAQMAAILCELDRSSQALDLLQSLPVVHRTGVATSKGSRRLHLSLAEVTLRLARYDDCDGCVAELFSYYEDRHDLDSIDNLILVRASIVRAVSAHLRPEQQDWAMVERSWQAAMNILRVAKSFRVPGYTDTVLQLWILDAQMRQLPCYTRPEDVADALKEVDDLGRQYYIPGFGTYWLDTVYERLRSACDRCPPHQ